RFAHMGCNRESMGAPAPLPLANAPDAGRPRRRITRVGGQMRRRIRCARFWAGLAVLGVIVAGGPETRAALSLQGIVITGGGGTVPGTDPVFVYSLDFTVLSNSTTPPTSFQLNVGDSVTVDGFEG